MKREKGLSVRGNGVTLDFVYVVDYLDGGTFLSHGDNGQRLVILF